MTQKMLDNNHISQKMLDNNQIPQKTASNCEEFVDFEFIMAETIDQIRTQDQLEQPLTTMHTDQQQDMLVNEIANQLIRFDKSPTNTNTSFKKVTFDENTKDNTNSTVIANQEKHKNNNLVALSTIINDHDHSNSVNSKKRKEDSSLVETDTCSNVIPANKKLKASSVMALEPIKQKQQVEMLKLKLKNMQEKSNNIIKELNNRNDELNKKQEKLKKVEQDLEIKLMQQQNSTNAGSDGDDTDANDDCNDSSTNKAIEKQVEPKEDTMMTMVVTTKEIEGQKKQVTKKLKENEKKKPTVTKKKTQGETAKKKTQPEKKKTQPKNKLTKTQPTLQHDKKSIVPLSKNNKLSTNPLKVITNSPKQILPDDNSSSNNNNNNSSNPITTSPTTTTTITNNNSDRNDSNRDNAHDCNDSTTTSTNNNQNVNTNLNVSITSGANESNVILCHNPVNLRQLRSEWSELTKTLLNSWQKELENKKYNNTTEEDIELEQYTGTYKSYIKFGLNSNNNTTATATTTTTTTNIKEHNNKSINN